MKRILRAISILTCVALVLSGLAAPASAISFNTLDSSTAVAGASKALSDFYTTNTNAGKLLTSFFKETEEHHAERETEKPSESGSEAPGENFGELVMYGFSKLGYVSAEALLNVRQKPTVNSDTVDVLYRGDEVYVYGEQKNRVITEEKVDDFLWYYVRNDSIGLEGFARSEFILFGDEGRRIADEVEAEKSGKMPGEFVIADSVDALPDDVRAALQAAVNDVNDCLKQYAKRNGIADKSTLDYINMYSILTYMRDRYRAALDIAENYQLSNLKRNGETALNLVLKECARLAEVTGKTEADLYYMIASGDLGVTGGDSYEGIALGAEYEAQQAAQRAAEEERKRAEEERRRAEQAAREAENEAARRAAEEAARRAAEEAEAARRAAEEAARKAAEEAQRAAAQQAAQGAGEAAGTTGRAIADYAASFVGILPYVWGGASLTTGAGCSGFLGQILAHFGFLDQGKANWHAYCSWDYRTLGVEVPLSEIQPGDILCYNGHVAMYYGNGIYVHEPNPNHYAEFGRLNPATVLTVLRFQ